MALIKSDSKRRIIDITVRIFWDIGTRRGIAPWFEGAPRIAILRVNIPGTSNSIIGSGMVAPPTHTHTHTHTPAIESFADGNRGVTAPR